MPGFRDEDKALRAEALAELEMQDCSRRATAQEEEAKVLEREAELLLERAREHREQADRYRQQSLKWEDRRAAAHDKVDRLRDAAKMKRGREWK